MRPCLAILAIFAAAGSAADAHDTWLQTNTSVIRSGDAVFIDLMLGNHGNDHRDFKLAGKPDLDACAVEILGPGGAEYDLKPYFVDRGYVPKEGFWTARFEPVKPGLYMVVQTSDQVESFAPVRVVRTAKTFFLVSADLDHVPSDAPGFDRILGRPLELVPLASTVAPMGPGTPIRVRLLFEGKPLANEKVSFIPAGETLKTGFDSRYERMTGADGSASFEPNEAAYTLVVSHHLVPEEGKGYKSINYTATMTVLVPAICPCCGE